MNPEEDPAASAPGYQVPEWIRFADFRSRVNHVAAYTRQPHPSGFSTLVAITGPRQAGKTKLAYELARAGHAGKPRPGNLDFHSKMLPRSYVTLENDLRAQARPVWFSSHLPLELHQGEDTTVLFHRFLLTPRSNQAAVFLILDAEEITLPPPLEKLTRRIRLAEPDSPF